MHVRLLLFTILFSLMPTVIANGASAEQETASPPRIIFLLDASGSMAGSAGSGQTKIAAAKQALTNTIKTLPSNVEIGIRLFGSKVKEPNAPGTCTDSTLVVSPSTNNRQQLNNAIKNYKPFGETPIPHGLREAAKDLGMEGPRTIVLVTDGESTCSPTPCETVKQLRKTYKGLTVSTLGLGVNDKSKAQLECAATAGGGSYYDASNTSALGDRLARVARRAADPLLLDSGELPAAVGDNPPALTQGSYTSELSSANTNDSEKRFLIPRTEAGTEIRVTASSPGGSFNDELFIELVDNNGDECSKSESYRSDGVSLLSVQASLGNACASVGNYYAIVTHDEGDKNIPITIKVLEEPARLNPGFNKIPDTSYAVKAKVNSKPKKTVGSANFKTAPRLKKGVYEDIGVVGEPTFYRVPLTYGQAMNVTVVFPKAVGVNATRITERIPVSLQLYNPTLGQLAALPNSVTEGEAGFEKVELWNSTPRVSSALKDYYKSDYSLAGDYYVSVSVADYPKVFEMPYTLKIEVTGEVEDGPAWDGGEWTVENGQKAVEETLVEEQEDRPTITTAPPAEPEVALASNAWRVYLWAFIAFLLVFAVGFYFWTSMRQAQIDARREFEKIDRNDDE